MAKKLSKRRAAEAAWEKYELTRAMANSYRFDIDGSNPPAAVYLGMYACRACGKAWPNVCGGHLAKDASTRWYHLALDISYTTNEVYEEGATRIAEVLADPDTCNLKKITGRRYRRPGVKVYLYLLTKVKHVAGRSRFKTLIHSVLVPMKIGKGSVQMREKGEIGKVAVKRLLIFLERELRFLLENLKNSSSQERFASPTHH